MAQYFTKNVNSLFIMQPEKQKRALKTSPFILKLAKILENPDHADLIGWQDCDSAFEVHHPCEFSATLLPKYFRHCNYGSFLRQLNFYSFVKVKCHSDSVHQFTHPLFQRAHPDQFRLIKRQKVTPGPDSRQPDPDCHSSQTPAEEENLPSKPLEVQISSLRKSQSKMLQNCRALVDQSNETIEWGLIKSAEVENQSSHNQIICNRIFDFIDRYPHLAQRFSYFDTNIINNLLNHLDTHLPTTYPPLVDKFFGIVENSELWAVVDTINSSFSREQKKRKSFTIVPQRERRISFEAEPQMTELPPHAKGVKTHPKDS